MPQVPRLNRPVEQASFPGVRVDTTAPKEAFGGGASSAQATSAATGLLKSVTSFAEEEKKKADDALTQQAYSTLLTRKNSLIYDENDGLLTKKGEKAFGVSAEYGEAFDKQADDIEQSMLKNESQRAMFRQMREREKRSFDGQLQKHAYTEIQKFQEDVVKSGIQAAQNDAILNFHEPGRVQQSIQDQKNMILSQAEGKPQTLVDIQLREAESKTHAGVINRMLSNGEDLPASDYFKTIKGTLTAEDTIRVERALEEGTRRGNSQRMSQELTQRHGSLSAALAEVDKIDDPKLQDEVRTRVKQRFGEQEQAIELASARSFESAYKIVEKSKNLDDIPPSLMAGLKSKHKEALKAYVKKDTINTDWDEYYNLKTLASSPETKDKFLRSNLLEYRDKLGNTEFKELVTLQAGLRKGDDKAAKGLDGYRTNATIVNDALAEAGIDATPKQGTEHAKKVNQFRRRVDEQLVELQERTGKKATNEDVQRIVDNLMVKGVTKKGWLWDTKKRVFETEPGEIQDFEVADIPTSERRKIENALKVTGKPVTDQAIVELYTRKQRGSLRAGQ